MSTVPRSKAIGQQIAMLRKLRGISQRELAEAIGIAKRTHVSTEAGDRSPRDSELRDIAEALEVPQGWLVSPDRYLPPTVELGPYPVPDEQTAQRTPGTVPFEHPTRRASVITMEDRRRVRGSSDAGRGRVGRAA